MRRPGQARRVLVVGGGVAAVGTAIGLARRTKAEPIEVTLLSEAPTFACRPLVVTEPFGGRVPSLPLMPLLRRFGVSWLGSRAEAVDGGARAVALADGSQRRYDALVVATGAAPHAPRPKGVTVGVGGPEGLRRLLRGLESGSTERAAFAVPSRHAWSLPVYEVALQTAAHLRRLGIEDRQLTIVTPEAAPLEVFGARAGEAVAARLERAGIGLESSTYPVAALDGELQVVPRQSLPAEEVVWGPALEPRALPGLPVDPRGFVPTDAHGRVQGLDGVYAAGDVTSSRLKQGGLAAQQATAAASSVMASFDRESTPRAFEPVLRAMLLTGSAPLFLRTRISNGEPVDQVVSDRPLWWPPAKLVAPHVAALRAASAPPTSVVRPDLD